MSDKIKPRIEGDGSAWCDGDCPLGCGGGCYDVRWEVMDMYVKITLPEGYEDEAPELVLEDLGISPEWKPEVVGPRPRAMDRLFAATRDANYSDALIGNMARAIFGRGE